MTSKCCTERTDPIIKLSDPKSTTIKFLNPGRERWYVWKVDGCLVSDDRKKCDNFLSDKSSFSVLIELKKGDVEGARKQLERSFEHPEIREILVGKRCALIVSSGVRIPNFDNFSRKSKEYFMTHYKARFLIARDDSQVCPKECCGL